MIYGKEIALDQMMKNLLFIFLIFFGTNSFGQSEAFKTMLESYYTDFPTISISDAYQHLKKRDAVFLDTRPMNEFKVSHINTATRIDPDTKIFDELDLKKDDVIIVYCSIGARSQSIGERLREAGYKNVYNLYGGLFNWANHKYPMVDNNDNRTTRIHGYSKRWGRWITRGQVVYK